MRTRTITPKSSWVLTRGGLRLLFKVLQGQGYTTVGPRIRDEVMVYDELSDPADLPEGWTDCHEPGRYRLKKRKDKALFGYVVGPHSWKKFLFPSEARLFSARRAGAKLDFHQEEVSHTRYAFIGVRACELAAIGIQDRVFINGPYSETRYETLRRRLFIVAVNCTESKGNCFCASMDTGPRARKGFDLALTEVLRGRSSTFVVEVGSDAGAAILGEIPVRELEKDAAASAAAAVEKCGRTMKKSMPGGGLKKLLYKAVDSPVWEDLARRCTACANCTMVCPTCFCSTVEDTSDLTGNNAQRWRRWDSCFSIEFSYMHGGSVRSNTRAKYRQWLTHKLASWQDQFGTSGCVGCGRCVTWCPVGIDLTESVRAIQENPSAGGI